MSVQDILMQMAQNAGRAQLQRGALLGNAISSAALVPGQILNDRENQAILDAQKQRLANQDARGAAQDARQAAKDAQDQAEAAQKAKEQDDRRAIITAGLDTTGPQPAWKLEPAVLEATRRGRSDIAKELIDAHNKTTEFDPKHGAQNAAGEITRQPQEEAPPIGTPAYEVWARRDALLHPPTPAPSAMLPGAMTAPPPLGAPVAPPGLIQPGNIDLTTRPRVQNGDGSVSTIRSMSFGQDGKEILIPTVINGRVVSDAEAIAAYKKTGQHLGIFDSPTAATAFAEQLHQREANGQGSQPPTSGMSPTAATLQAYADQREATKPDTHSPIYKEWKDYADQGGKLGFDAYMTADANRKKPVVNVGGMNALYGEVDAKAIAAQIRKGEHPPDISQYGRPAAAAIASELAKTGPNGEKPFNLSSAQREWNAQKKLNSTMNGPQQVRLDESIRSGLAMYDKVDELANQWDGLGIGPLSRANLAAAKDGLKGAKAASIANQLSGQIGQLTSDIATIEQGGLTPTNESRAVAEKSMQDWWGKGTIHDMTAQGRYNMQIRHTARNSQDVMVPGNPVDPRPAVAAIPVPQLPPNKTQVVEQNGVRYEVTTDAAGKVISSKPVPR